MRYHVKFPVEQVLKSSSGKFGRSLPNIKGMGFGIVRDPKWDKEAKQCHKKGLTLVEDVVYPFVYAIEHKHVVDLERERDYDAAQAAGAELLKELGFQGFSEQGCSSCTHPNLGPNDTWIVPYVQDEAEEYQVREYVAASLLSHSLGRERIQKGHLFGVGVADGSAEYVVTRVNKKTVQVEWRGFFGDRYVCMMLGYGCKVDRQRAETMCRIGLSAQLF